MTDPTYPRIAIIGCGYWGPNYIRAFNETLPGSVEVVCDSDRARLERVKSTFPFARGVPDYHDILEDPRVDAVCVSTPATTHHQIAGDCLLHGKHVLVEKPMALNVKDGEDLVNVAGRMKKVLMVGHVYLYHPAVSKIKELLSSGEFGELYYAYSVRTGLGPIRNDTNAMWDLAPHDVSMFLYLLGEMPHTVTATGGSHLQKGIEDVVLLSMEFPKRRFAYVHVSWLDPHKLRRLTIVGRDKMILFEDTNPNEKLKVFSQSVSTRETASYGEFMLQASGGDVFAPWLDSTEPLKNECKAFIDSTRGESSPLTDGAHGLQVVRVLEAASKSLKDGGLTVSVESK